MPRDATDTRARLLAAGERLYATRGVQGTTTREITEAAGQRNVSAVTYHFGGRAGLLHAILLVHGEPMDQARADLCPVPEDEPSNRRLVAALLVSYARALAYQEGRYYLRIVAQLSDQFALWRGEGDLTPPHLQRILDVLEHRTPSPGAVGKERVVSAIMLMTAAMAERAREIDDGVALALDDDAFTSNLADMLVALVEAPVGEPLTTALAGRN